MSRIIACYVHGDPNDPETRQQKRGIERWVDLHYTVQERLFHDDLFRRDQLELLRCHVWAGNVHVVAVWRLAHLGFSARGLKELFDEFDRFETELVAVRDDFQLRSAEGQRFADLVASLPADDWGRADASPPTAEMAAAALRSGRRKPRRRVKVTAEQESTIRRLRHENRPITAIAKSVGLSRPTVYDVLRAASVR